MPAVSDCILQEHSRRLGKSLDTYDIVIDLNIDALGFNDRLPAADPSIEGASFVCAPVELQVLRDRRNRRDTYVPAWLPLGRNILGILRLL
jgi:hypothetical protein